MIVGKEIWWHAVEGWFVALEDGDGRIIAFLTVPMGLRFSLVMLAAAADRIW
jgi:hypothetical protein